MTKLMQNSTDKSTKYHVSFDNLGKTVTLKPRQIYSCHPDEPSIKRICVCPTVTDCFVAMGDWFGRHFVYQTSHPTIEPYGVYDSFVTGEEWIVEPAEFKLVCELDDMVITMLYPALEMTAESLECQETRKRKLQKLIRKHGINRVYSEIKW